MPDRSQNAALVVELVQTFSREMSTITPNWEQAYLRIAIGGNTSEAKASYAGPSGIAIVDVIAHKPFFHWVNAIAGQLRDSLESDKPFKVALVVLNADFSYEVKYEHDNERRWAISKLNGASGIPEGH